MKRVHFPDVPTFVERASPLLLAHEAHNNLPLGLCAELAHSPLTFGPEPPVMLTVEADETVVLAALSQHQLDTGKRFCSLFTDLSNPTSNHSYQTIGYEPVVNIAELHFAPK